MNICENLIEPKPKLKPDFPPMGNAPGKTRGSSKVLIPGGPQVTGTGVSKVGASSAPPFGTP